MDLKGCLAIVQVERLQIAEWERELRLKGKKKSGKRKTVWGLYPNRRLLVFPSFCSCV